MKKQKRNVVINVAGITVGFCVLVALYLFLFADGDTQQLASDLQEQDKNSWKAFKAEVPKKTGVAPENRGVWIDETLQQEEAQKDLETRQKRKREQKSRIRLEHSDLSALLNTSTKAEKVEPIKKPSPEYKKEKRSQAGQRSAMQKKTTKKPLSISHSRPDVSTTPNIQKRKRTRKNAIGIEDWGQESKTNDKSSLSFEAVIHEEQKISSSGGTRITIRLIKPTSIDNCLMKANELYTARIVGLSGNRLQLQMIFTCEGERFSFDAYDEDGEKGIFVQDITANERTGQTVAGDVISEEAQRLGNKFGIGVVSRSISTILSTRGQKEQEITISSGKKIKFIRA